MFPVLMAIISKAASLADKNLSELKHSGKSSGPTISSAASMAMDLQKQLSSSDPVE